MRAVQLEIGQLNEVGLEKLNMVVGVEKLNAVSADSHYGDELTDTAHRSTTPMSTPGRPGRA